MFQRLHRGSVLQNGRIDDGAVFCQAAAATAAGKVWAMLSTHTMFIGVNFKAQLGLFNG